MVTHQDFTDSARDLSGLVAKFPAKRDWGETTLLHYNPLKKYFDFCIQHPEVYNCRTENRNYFT